jgi:hypothetical protein
LTEAPFESAEGAAANADNPSMEGHIEKTAGSGSQFTGETNPGRVVGSLIGPTKVWRHSAIGVAAHGKGMRDAIGYLIKLMVQEGVDYPPAAPSGHPEPHPLPDVAPP